MITQNAKIHPIGSFGAVIPNQKRLIDRAKPISEEVGLAGFFAPETIVSLARSALGIKSGDDPTGPIAIVATNPNLNEEHLVIVFAYKDLKALTDGEVKADGSIVQLDRFLSGQRVHAMAKDGCLWLSKTKEGLEGLAEKKSIYETISPAERLELANADLLVHLSPKVADLTEIPDDWMKDLVGEREELQKSVKTLGENFDALRITVTFDKGLRTQFRASFADKPVVRTELTNLLGTGQSVLKGLPLANQIVGGAVDGTSNGPPVLLRRTLMNWTPFWWRNEFGAFQFSAISELFQGVSDQIDHSAIGAYRSTDDRNGMMSLVAVLTPKKTPDEFIEELRSLSSFVSARVARDLRIRNVPVDYDEIERLVALLKSENREERNSAGTKLKIIGQPTLKALGKAAKSDDKPGRLAAAIAWDIRRNIQRQNRRSTNEAFTKMKPQFLFRRNSRKPKRPVIEVLLEPGKETDTLNKQLSPLFGSEWKRLRLVILDKHVVVLFGSDEALLESVVQAVGAGDNSLAEHESVTGFRQFIGEQRLAEWHFSMSEIMGVAHSRKPQEDTGKRTSLSLSRKPAQIRGDLFVPTKELKVWYGATR